MSTDTTEPVTPHSRAESTPPARPVAIIGAARPLGTLLVRALTNDSTIPRIITLDTAASPSSDSRVGHHHFDLASDDADDRLTTILLDEEIDTVVHLGFLASPTHRPDRGHAIESVGTMRAMEACHRTPVRKVVLWSETALYGASPQNPCFIPEASALLARQNETYFRDKTQAERDVTEFGLPGRGRISTILRGAPLLGPNVRTWTTEYFSQRWIPTILGFDPLMQFLHESDAVMALMRAVKRDAPGIFNIAGDGVVPLGKTLRLMGRRKLPLTRTSASALVAGLWLTRNSPTPPAFLDFLQYACVADIEAARRSLGFSPSYSSRDAIIDFGATQMLRDVKLISETPA